MSKCTASRAPNRRSSRWITLLRMFVPSATVFFSGGCLMILVLVASRLVARSLGSSLYTWTSILGVVLAGVSIGNYLGGRLADRCHPRRALAVLFGLSSAACIGILVSNNLADNGLWLWRLSWPSHVFIHVVLVFFPPSTLLGAVSPVVAKMAVGSVPVRASKETNVLRETPGDVTANVGRTIGSIYAWSAAGGLVGTLLAGFSLIVAFGHAALLWLLGAALLMMAVLYWVSCWAMYLWAMVFLALATMGMSHDPWAQEAGTAARLREKPDPNVVYETETPYGHVTIRQISKRPDRRVFMQGRLARGPMAVKDPTHLADFHLRVYAGLTRGLNGTRKDPAMLVMGAGGYALPRHLKAAWPNSHVEVVEIDPGVTRAATNAFGLDRDADIETIHMDARRYVDQPVKIAPKGTTARRYDFIYQDTLDSCAVPCELVTKEFHEGIAGLLADDGAYMIHLPDSYRSGLLLGAVVNTIRGTFPYVYGIVGRAGLASPCETSVVVAAKHPLDPQAILTEQDKHLRFSILNDLQIDHLKRRCGHIILTDDYAPVENLLAPVVRHSANEILARRYLDEAKDLQSENRYEPSIQWYHQALEADPSLAVDAYEQIGLMHVARNEPEEAVEAFRSAIRAQGDGKGRRTAIGSVHMHLGVLLGRLDRRKEGKDELAKAVEEFRIELEEDPGSVVAWEWLGDTSAALEDYKGASDAFDKAAALEPRHPSHYQKLARALEFQHRYDEAVVVVRKHVKLMQEQGRRDLAAQLSQYMELLQYKKVKQYK